MDSDTVTWIGTLLTALGTGITIWQARQVKKYKDQVAFDLRKVSLAEVGELLRRAQEDCRKLLKSGGRGQSISVICDSIQEKIDFALNRFNQKDKDVDIKEKLINANKLLALIRQSNSVIQSSHELHEIIRDAISSCNERITEAA
jgi:hypothetical protein